MNISSLKLHLLNLFKVLYDRRFKIILQDNNAFKEELNEKKMATQNERRFDEAVKSLIKKLQPESEYAKKLKDSPLLSTERELQIHDAKRQGFPADFEEQKSANEAIYAHNCKITGVAMALEAVSASYGIRTFSAKRFREEYLV